MLPFVRNIFSSSFLLIPFFVENYNAILFLVNFDKEPLFLAVPKILFLFIFFLIILNVPRWLPVTPYVSLLQESKSSHITSKIPGLTDILNRFIIFPGFQNIAINV